MKDARVVLVAMPLMARSGVYQSCHDLVEAAHRRGAPWGAILGMRPSAPGRVRVTEGVQELETDARGRSGQRQIKEVLRTSDVLQGADVVVTLIPQSDVAMSAMRSEIDTAWVVWVRGAPWPAAGEQSRLNRWMKRLAETRALRTADDVWATTPVLAASFDRAAPAILVPAGIPTRERVSDGSADTGTVLWAGRVDIDKRPGLFAALVSQVPVPARAYGDGPLLETMRDQAPHVDWAGWANGMQLWTQDSIFLGTSAREAFGRSAVEAAASGVPVVISDQYGAAPLLITDPELQQWCIVESTDPAVWAAKVQRLVADKELRMRVSQHVYNNARALTIERSLDAALDRIATVVGED